RLPVPAISLPVPAILELWLPFRPSWADSFQPQLQDRGERGIPGRGASRRETAVETELFIGGKWVPASSGDRFDVLDPATGDVIASVADGGESDAMAAVDAAAAAGKTWAKTPP